MQDMIGPNNFLHNLIKKFSNFWPNREGQSEEDLEGISVQELKFFAFETLVSATKNFHPSHKVGQGGFGAVYKGKLDDGREIAVKKLSRSSNQGRVEFLTEAKILAKVQHQNVVNLLGYCTLGIHMLLVYEYVINGSLDKILFESNRRVELDWKRRFDIINSIARGLLYLHVDSHNCIIHRDIKASNILLDNKWVPKITDFGLAHVIPEDQIHIDTCRLVGTYGYMAPEYVMDGQVSVKTDIYSFGVLVLELISSQKIFNSNVCAQGLLNWAYKLFKKGRCLEIMDPTLVSSVDSEEIEMCIRIGLLCVQDDPKLRPEMGEVVFTLSKKPSNLAELTPPGIPAFYSRISQCSTTRSSGASNSNTFGSCLISGSINLVEPTRPETLGSPYRRSHRLRATLLSSTAGTSGASESCTFGASLISSSITTNTWVLDPYGKRPMPIQGEVSYPQSAPNSSQVDKASWDVHLIRVFVEICVERCLTGDKLSTHFTCEGWKGVIDEFKRRTGKSYRQTQFENKWDDLKKDWQIWEKLRGETGVGWDNDRKLIVADNDWWERKIREDKRCVKFRYQPIENIEGLEILFGGQVAIGEHASNSIAYDEPVVPISSVDPVGTQPHLELIDSSSDLDNNVNSLDSSPPPEPVVSRRRFATPTGVNKRSRATPNMLRRKRPIEFAISMANLTDVIANRGKAPFEEDETLDDALRVLEEIEDVLAREQLMVFALLLMETPANRKFFLKMRKNEWRLMWIKDKWSRQMYTHSEGTASRGGRNDYSSRITRSTTDVYTPMPLVFSPTHRQSSGSQNATASPDASVAVDDPFFPFV